MLYQIIRFGGIGGLVTIVHVFIALMVRSAFDFSPFQANFVGFFCAVLLSYIGHARFTFGASETPFPQFLRFLFVALFGLAVSTGTVWLIDIQLGLSFSFAMISVGVLVPAATFVALRFWVFNTTA